MCTCKNQLFTTNKLYAVYCDLSVFAQLNELFDLDHIFKCFFRPNEEKYVPAPYKLI